MVPLARLIWLGVLACARWTVSPGSDRNPRRIREEGASLADHRSRQQYRPGAQGAEKEDATGRHLSRDEIAGPLRKTIGETGTRAGGGHPPLSQAAAQAFAARRPIAPLRSAIIWVQEAAVWRPSAFWPGAQSWQMVISIVT